MKGSDGVTTAGREARKIARIWKQYKRHKSPLIREFLIKYYRPLVRHHAHRLAKTLPEMVDVQDLETAGILGLMDCIDRYCPERKIKFETFSARRLRGSIVDELRVMDWVPRLVRTRQRDINRQTIALEAEMGRPASAEELSQRLRLPVEKLASIHRDAAGTAMLPLDNAGRDSGDQQTPISQIADTHSPDPALTSQRKALLEIVTRGMTRAERLIVMLYYYEALTMAEIGRVLDLSESRVSQMHTVVIARLKSSLVPEDLVA